MELFNMRPAFKASGPSKESVEVLTKLNAYYEHQPDLIKGFEENSPKTEEGLKTIKPGSTRSRADCGLSSMVKRGQGPEH